MQIFLLSLSIFAITISTYALYQFHLYRKHKPKSLSLTPLASLGRDLAYQHSDHAYFIFDAHGTLIDLNEAARSLYPALSNPSPYHIYLEEGGSFSIDAFSYYSKVTKLYNEDHEWIGYFTVLIDQSDLYHALDELAQAKKESVLANRTRNDFLSNISHEIRTPMNALVGMSELIMEESVGRRVYDFAHNVKIASNHLLLTFNDILDASSLKKQTLKLVPRPYHPKLLFDEIENIIQTTASSKFLDFTIQIDKNIPYELYGDRTRISQILLNLLYNSIHFTSRGSLSLHISSIVVDSDILQLIFVISDTGCGIEPAFKDSIFLDFVQIKSQSDREYFGAGLGLAIARQLALLMDGNIELTSTSSAGSTFTVTLQQKILDSRCFSQISSSEILLAENKISLFSAPQIKVLVVDDNRVNLNIASQLLLAYDLDITLASSGHEAISLAQQHHYDLILMDHMMPHMDGLETQKRIRGLSLPKEPQPIILSVTANVFSNSEDIFLDNGFDGFLPKPIESSELYQLLDKFIPMEKRSYTQFSQKESIPPSEEDLLRIAMSGIDVTLGVTRRSKGIPGYLELLEIFYMEGLEKLVKIEKHATKGDFENYRIEVHALKGVSATIGAMNLSQHSQLHELACKEMNTSYVLKDYPSLLYDYRCILDEIQRVLTQEGRIHQRANSSKNTIAISPQELYVALQATYQDMQNFNPKSAANRIRQLFDYQLPDSIDEVLSLCQTKLKLYDDDAVEEILANLLIELEKTKEES